MRRLLLAFAVVGLACTLQLSVGCGKKDTGKSGGEVGDTEPESTEPEQAATPLEAKARGTLKGKVTLEGTPPKLVVLEGVKKHNECLQDAPMKDKVDQTWMVGEGNGVANAVVWVLPPKGKYFKLSDKEKKRTDVVKLEQPHCAFHPHVLALFPSYVEGDEEPQTGQKFEVVNNARGFNHNTKITGGGNVNKDWDSGSMEPDPKEKKPHAVKLKPQKTPLTVQCNIHEWMRAKIWVFDNPYHAVTKEDGTFEIKDVPAKVKVRVVAWHEGASPAYPFTPNGREMTLMEGDNEPLDITLHRKE
jgi:hypothetical protein